MGATLFRRLTGAAMLDAATYEEVEADRSATPQALVVVVASSLAAAIGIEGENGGADALALFAGVSVLALLTWAAWALLTFEIGSRLLPTPDTRVDPGELLRTLGFAAAPGLLQVFGVLPGMKVPVLVVCIAWALAASVVAVRQSLDYTSTGRALAVCGLGGALSLVVAIVLGLVLGSTVSGQSGDTAAASRAPYAEGAVLRIQIVGSGGVAEGTGFLVHQERREHEVVHYFLTSAHLLAAEDVGERRTASLRIRVMLDDSSVIETTGGNAVFPGGSEQGLDLAIVKAVSATTSLVPIPVYMEPPQTGQAFVVRGRQGLEWTSLSEQVRFRSTRLIVGDRTTENVAGLLGAPAMVDGGAFGLVSECSASRVPVITLLSAARGFLSRGLPGWTPAASVTPAFTLDQRLFDEALLKVACDAVATGEVDVPIELEPREKALEATASFTRARALRLGDVTALSLHDQLVKLRFTMAGMPANPFPAPGPKTQALVTVGVNVLVLPRPQERFSFR